MSDMVQELETLIDTDGIVFDIGKTPQPKNKLTATLGKVSVIGYKESRGHGDDTYYVVQFENGSVIRVYNPKSVVFGKPKAAKPQIQKPTAGEVLLVGKGS